MYRAENNTQDMFLLVSQFVCFAEIYRETWGNFSKWNEIDMKAKVWGDNSVMQAYDSDVSANCL